MANEISIQAVLIQQRFSPVIQGAATKDITAASSKGAYNSIVSVNALDVQILNGCAINKATSNVTPVGGSFSTADTDID
jgi:hypothetical protein